MQDPIHEVIHKGRQSLNGQRIVRHAGKKLKADIDRDSYDFQSSANVSVLTDIGWKVLTYLPIEECAVIAFTYGTREETWKEAMSRDLDRLLALGVEILS